MSIRRFLLHHLLVLIVGNLIWNFMIVINLRGAEWMSAVQSELWRLFHPGLGIAALILSVPYLIMVIRKLKSISMPVYQRIESIKNIQFGWSAATVVLGTFLGLAYSGDGGTIIAASFLIYPILGSISLAIYLRRNRDVL